MLSALDYFHPNAAGQAGPRRGETYPEQFALVTRSAAEALGDQVVEAEEAELAGGQHLDVAEPGLLA